MVGFCTIYGSRRLVLSIYTGAGGGFLPHIQVAGGWFSRYIREPEVGSLNI